MNLRDGKGKHTTEPLPAAYRSPGSVPDRRASPGQPRGHELSEHPPTVRPVPVGASAYDVAPAGGAGLEPHTVRAYG
jgi:hypothetical protein